MALPDLGIDFDQLTSELGSDLGDIFGKVAGSARGGLERVANAAQSTGGGLERIARAGGGADTNLARIALAGGGGGDNLGAIANYGNYGGGDLDFFQTIGAGDPFKTLNTSVYTPPAPEPPASSGYPTGGAGVGATGADPATDQWRDLIDQAAAQYGIDGDAIQAVMMIESQGNPNARSGAGATGLMQVMPFHFGPGEDPMDPRTNVMKGASILADNYKRYGNWDSAVAAYLGAVDSQGNPTTSADMYGTTGIAYAQKFNQYYQQIKARRTTQPGRPNGVAVDPNGYSFPVVDYHGTIQLHHGSHQGAADIFAAAGTAVVAMRGGKVTGAGYDETGGNYVMIQGDDGNEYYYAHLQSLPAVRAGQAVGAGVLIGQVGDTGNAKGTGAHLHIGIGPSILTGTGPAGGAGSGGFNATALLQQVYQNQYAR